MLGSCMTSRSTKPVSGAAGPAKKSRSVSEPPKPTPFLALLDASAELDKSCRTEGLSVAGCSVNFQKKCVSVSGWNIRLAPVELMIFARLLAAPSEVIRSGEFHSLLARWTGDAQPDELSLRLRVNMSKMRAKFARHGIPAPFEAVAGVGYRFRGDCDAKIPNSVPRP